MADEIQSIDFSIKTNGAKSAKATLVNLVKSVGSALNGTTAEVDKLSAKFDKATAAVEKQKLKVDELQQKLTKLSSGEVAPKSTSLNNLNKEFDKTIATIEKLEQKEDELKAKQAELLSVFPKDSGMAQQLPEYKALESELATVKTELEQARSKSDELANSLQNAQGTATQAEIQKTTTQLDLEKAKLTELQQTADATGKKMSTSINPFKQALENAGTIVTKFGARIMGLVKRVFVFTLITKGLRAVRDTIGAVLMSDSAFISSLNQLQSALWTAFAPILEVAVPALKVLIGWIANAIAGITKFISLIIGKSYNAWVKEGSALKDRVDKYNAGTKAATSSGKAGVKAAKDETKALEKELATFDELQILRRDTQDSSDMGTGGGADTGAIAASTKGLKDAFEELQNFKLPEFFTRLALTIKDVFFDWKEPSTEEAVAEKVITAGFAVLGAVIGHATGGVKGAFIGFTLGTALGLAVSAITFDGDGKISEAEKDKILNIVKGGLLGAAIGASVGWLTAKGVGAVTGAAMGFTIGASITALVQTIMFDKDGALKPDVVKWVEKIRDWIADVLLVGMSIKAIVEAGAAAAAGGTVGAGTVLSLTVGMAAIALVKSLTFDKDGNLTPDGQKLKDLIILLLSSWIAATTGLKLLKGAALTKELGEAGATAVGMGAGTAGMIAGIAASIGVVLTLFPIFKKETWKSDIFPKSLNLDKTKNLGKNIKKTFNSKTMWQSPAKAFGQSAVGGEATSDLSKGLQSFFDLFTTKASAAALESGEKIGGKITNGIETQMTTNEPNISTKATDLNTAVTGAFADTDTWFSTKFTDSYDKATGAFDGLGTWGQDQRDVLTDKFSDTDTDFSTWFTNAYDAIGTAFTNIGTWAQGVLDDITSVFDDEVDGIKEKFSSWFTNAYTAVTDAFKDTKTFFTGVKDDVVEVFQNIGSSVGTKVSDGFKSVINGVLKTVEDTINSGIKFINGAIDKMNKIPGVTLGHIGKIDLPRLAQGTVVPPNKEFAAILGDNKKEPEIVSPISTMEQAVENVLSRMGYSNNSAPTEVVLKVNDREFGRAVVELGGRAKRVKGNTFVKTKLIYG